MCGGGGGGGGELHCMCLTPYYAALDSSYWYHSVALSFISPIMATLLSPDQRPSLQELLKFPRGNGHVNILQEIGRKHTKLSAFLLNDETGTIADSITKEQMGDAEDINTAIVSRWLRGKGRQPVTWRTLIAVLQDAGLNTLADDLKL